MDINIYSPPYSFLLKEFLALAFLLKGQNMPFYPYSNSEFDTWIAFNVVWVVELFWDVKNAKKTMGNAERKLELV